MTKAAEELHIAQPSISKTIARLEQDIGVPLFDRYKQKIRLNAYGQLFLKQVDAALHLLEEGKKQIIEQAGLEHGRVFLATSNHICDAELIASFLKTHPEVNLRLTQAITREEKIQLLQAGELDFCVTSLPIEHDEIEKMELFQDEIFLVVPPTHRFADRNSIHLSEVAKESFVGLPEQSNYRQLTTEFCKTAGFEPNITCEVDRFPVVSDFVKREMGVALLPKDTAKQASSLVFIPILEPICQRSFQLIWMKNLYLSKAAHIFRDFLVAFYKNL